MLEACEKHGAKEWLAGDGACGEVGEGFTGDKMPELDLKGCVGDWQVNTIQEEVPGDRLYRGTEMCILETTSTDRF